MSGNSNEASTSKDNNDNEQDSNENDSVELGNVQQKVSDAFAPDDEVVSDQGESKSSNESSGEDSDGDEDSNGSNDDEDDDIIAVDENEEVCIKYPHLCQICDAKFILNFQLKNHMVSVHEIQVKFQAYGILK